MRGGGFWGGLWGGLAGLAALAAAGFVAAQEAPPPKPAAVVPSPPSPVAPAASPPPATAPSEPAISPASPLSPETPDDTPTPKPAAPAAPETPKPPPEPLKRPRFTAAVLQGVDKITAETMRFEVKVGEPVRFKGLIVTVRACETTAADETITDSLAYADVLSQPQVLPGRAAAPPRLVFHGWMFASSPSLHPLEHSVYDLWLIACKTAAPGA